MSVTNIFIVDSDREMVSKLKQYLITRFGGQLNISTFYSGESCLEKVTSRTDIVILDLFFSGKDGDQIHKSIKAINPLTEVIFHTSNENIADAIDSFRNGAIDYIFKGKRSLRKVASHISNLATYPVRILVKEFGISKYLAIFLLSFLTIGIIVFISMKFYP